MKVPYQKAPCAHCPFRKDSLKGWLGKERMTGILNQGSFVCHKRNDLQCAGHMVIRKNNNDFVAYAESIELDLPISNTELLFDNEEDCINHHT